MLDSLMSYLGSTLTPGQANNQLWALIYVFIIFAGVSVAVMAMNWIERKALAHFQVRLGPMRVGPHGLLQPIADAVKLLIKEDIIPAEADKFVFWIAPLIGLLASFTVYTVVPFGPSQAVSDMNIGILFMLGVSSLAVLGVVMAGWASNSHYPLIGALRSSAQMVSYEVAMGLAVVSAILMTSLHGRGLYGVSKLTDGTGTLSMIGIVQAQQEQHVWFLFKFFPLGLIAFVRIDGRIPHRIQRLALVALHAGGIRGHDCRLVDRGDALARGMDASVRELAQWVNLGLRLCVVPWTDIPGSGSYCICWCCTHAEAQLLPGADDWTRRIWCRVGADRNFIAQHRHRSEVQSSRYSQSHRRRPEQRLLVCVQSRRVHVSVHLVSRHMAALPL